MSYDMLPVPDPDLASARFFAALDRGRIEIQRCVRCRTPHLAVILCDACGGDVFLAEHAAGSGVIYSATRCHTVHHPAFADLVPFTGGIVELSEGPRLFAPLLGPGPFAVGQAVTSEVLPVGERKLAAFRRTDATA